MKIFQLDETRTIQANILLNAVSVTQSAVQVARELNLAPESTTWIEKVNPFYWVGVITQPFLGALSLEQNFETYQEKEFFHFIKKVVRLEANAMNIIFSGQALWSNLFWLNQKSGNVQTNFNPTVQPKIAQLFQDGTQKIRSYNPVTHNVDLPTVKPLPRVDLSIVQYPNGFALRQGAFPRIKIFFHGAMIDSRYLVGCEQASFAGPQILTQIAGVINIGPFQLPLRDRVGFGFSCMEKSSAFTGLSIVFNPQDLREIQRGTSIAASTMEKIALLSEMRVCQKNIFFRISGHGCPGAVSVTDDNGMEYRLDEIIDMLVKILPDPETLGSIHVELSSCNAATPNSKDETMLVTTLEALRKRLPTATLTGGASPAYVNYDCGAKYSWFLQRNGAQVELVCQNTKNFIGGYVDAVGTPDGRFELSTYIPVDRTSHDKTVLKLVQLRGQLLLQISIVNNRDVLVSESAQGVDDARNRGTDYLALFRANNPLLMAQIEEIDKALLDEIGSNQGQGLVTRSRGVITFPQQSHGMPVPPPIAASQRLQNFAVSVQARNPWSPVVIW